MDLSRRHREEQDRVWQELEDCEICARAEVLSDEIAGSPELVGLPKPDLSGYWEARRRVATILPEGHAEGRDRVTFSPPEAERTVADLRALAPEAERQASQYFYDALRGYEATLGPQECRRVSEMLNDPVAVRQLRQQHPDLFEREIAPAGMGSMLPMMMMFYLMSAHSPGWSGPRAAGSGTGDVTVDEWLAGYEVPASDALMDLGDLGPDMGSDWDAGDGDGGDFGGGGGDFGGGSGE